ncbi:MAG: hypothetical protein R2873_21670 [Caldilineaceae bacterium]
MGGRSHQPGRRPQNQLRPLLLIIVGPDTGKGYDFDIADLVPLLLQTGKPFLGLGDGGAALFHQFDLFIGYGQTWASSNNNVYAVAPTTVFWNQPYVIEMNREKPLVALYPRPLRELGVYIPETVKTVTPIAREENDAQHYPVVFETRGGIGYILWGYNAGPTQMTEDGRHLVVNLAEVLK